MRIALATPTNRRPTIGAHLAFMTSTRAATQLLSAEARQPLNRTLGMEADNTKHTVDGETAVHDPLNSRALDSVRLRYGYVEVRIS
jgi:hypothetical protein